MDLFDSRDFERPQKRGISLFSFAMIWWGISALISLGLLGVVGYVAYHFLSKYW